MEKPEFRANVDADLVRNKSKGARVPKEFDGLSRRHARKSGHPETFDFPGFRVALAIASLPGMTIELCSELPEHQTRERNHFVGIAFRNIRISGAALDTSTQRTIRTRNQGWVSRVVWMLFCLLGKYSLAKTAIAAARSAAVLSRLARARSSLPNSN